MSLAPELPKEDEPVAAPDRPSGRRPSPVAALLLRLHFYAGLLVAPFIVVAAVTGLLYTFTPQLDQALYRDELRVATVGQAARPLAEQLAAARTAHPDGALVAVQPGEGERTTAVVFSLPELGEKNHTVYVDPYTAQVRGQLTTWFGSSPAQTWFDDLHRNLHLGVIGRHYSELAASWLWIIALGGLVLWLRRVRGVRNPVRRALFQDLKTRKGVRRTRGWHATTGVWLLAGLLVLSATGLTWSRYAGANFGDALDALDARTPEVATAAPADGGQPAAGGHHGSGTGAATVDPAAADRVAGIARDNGLDGPIEIGFPADATSAWTVAQIDNRWPVGYDRIAVDADAGTVVDRSNFADWPLLAQLSKLGVQAHMGTLFGWVNQILLAALALGLLCVVFWGYRMWWQRRPTRAGRRALAGTPPVRRGAWQRLPAWVIAAGIPLTIAVGWALPLLGVSLAAFLVADLIAGAVQSRRRPEPDPVPVSPAPAGERR